MLFFFFFKSANLDIVSMNQNLKGSFLENFAVTAVVVVAAAVFVVVVVVVLRKQLTGLQILCPDVSQNLCIQRRTRRQRDQIWQKKSPLAKIWSIFLRVCPNIRPNLAKFYTTYVANLLVVNGHQILEKQFSRLVTLITHKSEIEGTKERFLLVLQLCLDLDFVTTTS